MAESSLIPLQPGVLREKKESLALQLSTFSQLLSLILPLRYSKLSSILFESDAG